MKYACKRLDGHLKWTEKLVRVDFDRGMLFITYDEVVADKVHVLKKFGRWLGFEAELESLVPEFQRVADFLTPSKSKSKPGKAALTLDESHFRSGDASFWVCEPVLGGGVGGDGWVHLPALPAAVASVPVP